MELYNTYPEAMEAHPDCDAVLTTGPDWGFAKSEVGKFRPAKKNAYHEYFFYDGDIPVMRIDAWVIAEPPKEDEFKNGDVVYGDDGASLIYVGVNPVIPERCFCVNHQGHPHERTTGQLAKTPPNEDVSEMIVEIVKASAEKLCADSDGELKNGDVVYIPTTVGKKLFYIGKSYKFETHILEDGKGNTYYEQLELITKTPPLKEGWYLCGYKADESHIQFNYKTALYLTSDGNLIDNDGTGTDVSDSYKIIATMTIGEEL